MVSSSARPGAGMHVWGEGSQRSGVQHIEVAMHGADGDKEARTTEDDAATLADVKQPRAVMFRIPVYQFEAGPFEVPGA